MMLGRTASSLFAMAFEPIFTSTFMSDIVLQFDISLPSLSFFSTSVMIARFLSWTILRDHKSNLGSPTSDFRQCSKRPYRIPLLGHLRLAICCSQIIEDF